MPTVHPTALVDPKASLADDVVVMYRGRVMEAGKEYQLFRLTVPGSRWLVITSGFHGEEPAGPLTLAESFPEIAAYARARDVGLRVYPCINPSGFEVGTPYERRSGFDPAGRDGVRLSERWAEGMRTLHGIHVHGLPNAFLVQPTHLSTVP